MYQQMYKKITYPVTPDYSKHKMCNKMKTSKATLLLTISTKMTNTENTEKCTDKFKNDKSSSEPD